jgi:hypothetical protein
VCAPAREAITSDRVLHSYYREISADRLPEFLAKGYRQRHFFPHHSYYIPKCGPDGLKMANRMCGVGDPSRCWEVVVYACSPLIDEFPGELFFDDDLVWHQQQFGKIGHIAFADLVVKGRTAYGMNYISDLVQRISRRREHKTRVENRFKGWAHMLLNSVLNFASELKIGRFYSATADLSLHHTDPKRQVQRQLFDRIYDRTVSEHWQARREGDWWCIDVGQNQGRIVAPERKRETIETEKTICVCHDIERGRGHVGIDAALAQSADQLADQHLDEMLKIEREMEVKATYNVLGCLFNEVRDRIESDGHCFGFHSYDHTIEAPGPFSKWYHRLAVRVLRRAGSSAHHRHAPQLDRLREIDYRIKGYRPPRSRISAEISDERLCYHNFEWLASSAHSLGIRSPTMSKRLARIPIRFDDFDLYRYHGAMSYPDWEQRALSSIAESDFVAFSLHDCYAPYWLPHYDSFLQKVRGLGTLKTVDEVANEVTLASCR